MALFELKWLRRLVRRNTKEIPVVTAERWKIRLSLLYILFAWNAFGFVVWNVFKGKADWAKYYNLKSEEELNLAPGQYWAKTLGIKKAKVYSVSGFNVSEYDINEEKERTDTTENNTNKEHI